MDMKRKLEVMKEIDEANKRHMEKWKEQQKAEADDRMTAVFVDVYNEGRIRPIRVKRDLKEYYKLLDCRTVDMPFRWIGGEQFVIICDDEGTFRQDCRPSARNGNEVMLYGNLLVVAFDGCEDIRGLTDSEVKHVMKHVHPVGRMNSKGQIEGIWEVLTDVTYSQEE